MTIGTVLSRTVRLTAGGVLGVAAVDGARSLVRRGSARRGAVTATTWALRGLQHAEVGAEVARLTGADIVAEARGRLGRQSPAPGSGSAHDHAHAHAH